MSMRAWDDATEQELQKIRRQRFDKFGDEMHVKPVISYERVLCCVAEKPMRARQIAVRTHTRRSAIEEACADLVSHGRLLVDEERFFSIRQPEIH